MKKLITLCTLGLSAVLVACNVQYFENAEFDDNIIFDPSIAVAFGELNYTVDELFEQLNDANAGVTSNNEGVVTIVYSEQLQSQGAQEFLQVPDQSFGSSLPSGVNISNPPTTTVVTVSESYEFDLTQRGAEEYDSIFFQSGSFEFSVESDFNANIDFVATFTSLETSDAPLVMSGSLSSSNNSFSETEPLDGYVGYFHLDSDGNPASNKFLVEITYDIEVTPSSSISDTDRVSFNLAMTNTKFDAIYGFVDSQELEVSFEIVNFDFFKQFDTGGITFADPKVNFVFNNSFGFPLGVDFQDITATNSDGQSLSLEGDIISQLNAVAGPRLVNEGQTRTTEIEVNNSNSNLVDLLSLQPERIVVDVKATSNPNGVPFQYNFINDQSILDVGVDIEIPFDMTLDGLQAEESMPFSPPEDIDQAKRLMIRLASENYIPMGGKVEIQFLGANNNLLHSVDEQAVFEGAEVGTNGRTNEPARATADFVLEEDDIQSIKDAETILLLVTLTTTDADQGANVKLFDDYELKFKVSGQLDIVVNANGN